MPALRTATDAWDAAEQPLMRFLLRVILYVALIAATPFFALGFLFVLLQKPLLWTLIAASAGVLLLLLGLIAWLVVRARLRGVREALGAVTNVEDVLFTEGPPGDNDIVRPR